jgi:glycosyltransferase involved in cell wall biosynthesis
MTYDYRPPTADRGLSTNAISAIIPAYNEEKYIGEVVKQTRKFADEVIVVDDHSTDNTKELCQRLGAKVVTNEYRKGYIGAIKTGFQRASREIIVTLDADGEHEPGDIPRLVEPILMGKADLVLGRRQEIPRISERFINSFTNLQVKVADSGTGFRALKKELASKLDLKGKCTCGTLVLEANHHGATIVEVPITVHRTPERRSVAWGHFRQIFYVLPWLFRPTVKKSKNPTDSINSTNSTNLDQSLSVSIYLNQSPSISRNSND